MLHNMEMKLHGLRTALKAEPNLTPSQKSKFEQKIYNLKKQIKTFLEQRRMFELTLIATCDEIYYNFLDKYHRKEKLVPQCIRLSGTFDSEIIQNYFQSTFYKTLVESYNKINLSLEYNFTKNKVKITFNPVDTVDSQLIQLSADFF